MNRPPSRTKRTRPVEPGSAESRTLDFGRRNLVLFAIGIGLVVVGFILLGTGDITVAPVLLVAGYLGFIPWALVANPHRKGGAGEG
jgi:hypothetical protein